MVGSGKYHTGDKYRNRSIVDISKKDICKKHNENLFIMEGKGLVLCLGWFGLVFHNDWGQFESY